MSGKGQAILAWLLIAWTVAVSARYVRTILKSLEHPYNPGDEVIFVVVWLGFAVLLLCSLTIHRNAGTILWSVLIGAITIAIPILSGTWVDALIAVWVGVLVVLIGCSVLSILRVRIPEHPAERIAVAFPLGFASLAFLTLALALTKQLTSATAWLLLAVLTLMELKNGDKTLRELWKWCRTSRVARANLEFRALLLLLAFAFAINLTWSVAPEVEYDALNYHLAVPRIYLEAHGVIDLPYFFHSYFAHLAEMFFAFCMALHSEIVAKIMTAAAGLVSIASVYSLGRMMFTPRVGIWAAAFFYMTPLTSWLTGTAHTDLLVTVFVTAAIIGILNWYRNRQSRWAVAAGLLTGGGVGVKLNAMYAAMGIALVLVVILIRTGAPLRDRIRTAATLATTAALVAIPWYLMTYVHTGNPVFPMMNGIFKSPGSEPVNTLMNAADFGIGRNLWALSRLPFRLSLDTSRFGDALPAGTLGPMLLFLIPFGLMAIARSSEARIAGTIAAIYFLMWAKTFQYGRYYIVVLPVIAVLAVAGVEIAASNRLARTIHGAALMILLILQPTVLSIKYWNIRERFPVEFALGLESRESLLQRALGGFPATAVINKAIAPGQKVVGVDTENLRFYLKPPLESLSESPLNSKLRTAGDTPGGEDLRRALSDMNFGYILTSRAALVHPPAYFPYLAQSFLRDYTWRVYADESVAVYRLKALADTRQP